MTGGHLRGLFADGLDEAAAVLDEPALTAEAQRWREIADRWHVLAETALPDDVPAIARLRDADGHDHRGGRRGRRGCR